MLSNRKTIFLISGPLGVGKSSLAKMINQKLAFAYIDGDALFGPLENVSKLSWEERLKTTWNSIALITREFISKDLDVVIDFVIEEELPWFLKEISDLNVRVKYVVLLANRRAIVERLKKRDGGTQYLERSSVLLSKLKSDPHNEQFIFETSGKNTKEVFEEVKEDDRFVVE